MTLDKVHIVGLELNVHDSGTQIERAVGININNLGFYAHGFDLDRVACPDFARRFFILGRLLGLFCLDLAL